jgi:sensor domain CHASE-containing protein
MLIGAYLKNWLNQSRKGFFSSYLFLFGLGLCMVTFSVILWKTQEARNLNHVVLTTQSKAKFYSYDAELRYNRIYTLERLITRGIPGGVTSNEEWIKDAEFFINSFNGIKFIAWVDKSYRIQLIAPLQENAAYLNQSASTVKRNPLDVYLWVPFYEGVEFQGYVFGAINIADFFAPVVNEIKHDYMFQLEQDGTKK